MSEEAARRAVMRIVANLCARRGLQQVWESYDEETQQQIEKSWIRIVVNASSKKVIIMRRSVLMEDEGRDSYIKNCATRAEAREWINAQGADEYFQSSDYYIAESVE